MRENKRKYIIIAVTVLLVGSILYFSSPFFEKMFFNIEAHSLVNWQNTKIKIPENAKYIAEDSNILIFQADYPECNVFIYLPKVSEEFSSIETNVASYLLKKQNKASNFTKIQYGGEPALKFDVSSQIEDAPEGGVYFINKEIMVLYKNMNNSKLLNDVLSSIIFITPS